MSTNPALVPISLVSQFLASSKLSSRHWLQCQMECLLDQVFDQLSTKFEDYLASNAITGTAHHTTIHSDPIQHQHRHEPHFEVNSRTQFQATTDHLTNTEITVAVGQLQNRGQMKNGNRQVNADGIFYEMNQNDDNSLDARLSNRQLNEDIDDDASRVDIDEVEVKEEIVDTNNQLIITDRHLVDQMSTSLSAPASNEQSNHNLTNGDDEDEDDCDCDECRSGIEVKKEEEDDDDDGIQTIENNEEELTLPNKKPRIDTTEPNRSRDTRQSSRLVHRNQTDQVQSNNEQTEEADETIEVNIQETQFKTLRVQCRQSGCSLAFENKIKLNAHMNTQHGLLPHQCVVKDCKQSFSTQNNLRGHIKQVHSSTTQWHCDKCPNNFPAYSKLSVHNYLYHQLGQYQCTFFNCTFTAEHRQKVHDHYKHQHKNKIQFICQHPGCRRRFKNNSIFKLHQQAHLGIKPYRCKWLDCGYASAIGSNTIAHIKNKHLKQTSTEASPVDPREYFEVLHELI